MKNKKIVAFLGVAIFISMIILIFFMKNGYKISKIGNNKISNTTEGVTQHILNMSSYEAKIELQVISNKNENRYVVKQQFVGPNVSKQVVLEPSNIENLTTTFDGNNLKIENSKLNLSTMYENYKYVTENNLFLNYFVEDYKNSEESKSKEKNGVVLMETKVKEGNKYAVSKKLYVDKNSATPLKMEVQDFNQNTIVYILYNEIKINSTKMEEVLAYKSVDILSNI